MTLYRFVRSINMYVLRLFEILPMSLFMKMEGCVCPHRCHCILSNIVCQISSYVTLDGKYVCVACWANRGEICWVGKYPVTALHNVVTSELQNIFQQLFYFYSNILNLCRIFFFRFDFSRKERFERKMWRDTGSYVQ